MVRYLILWALVIASAATAQFLQHRRGAFTAGSTFPTTNLIAFWPMDEASGNAIDSHATYDLTDNNTVQSASSEGPQGNATVRLFNDTDEFFSHADDAAFDVDTGDFSFSAWVKIPSTSTANESEGLIGKRSNLGTVGYSHQIRRQVTGDGIIELSTGCEIEDDSNNEVANTAGVDLGADDTWVHWMWVIDRTADTMKVFADNSEVDSVSISAVTGTLANAEPFWVGRATAQYWDGYITHVGFWKKALDASERTSVYNGGVLLKP